MPNLLNNRNRTGRQVTLAQSVTDGATGRVRVVADIAQAVLDDPDTEFTLQVERLVGGEWVFDAGSHFVGGPNQGKGGAATVAPGFVVNAADYAGQQIRGVLDIPAGKTVRMGLDLDILSPAAQG